MTAEECETILGLFLDGKYKPGPAVNGRMLSQVDWTKPHRENVKASVQAAVKMVLRRRGVRKDHFQFILNRVMEQAEARYESWPMAA